MEKIVLECQKCGGSLEITSDMEIFKCQFCGMPYLVERKEGSIKIIKLEQRVEKVEKKQEAQDMRLLVMQIEDTLTEINKVFEGYLADNKQGLSTISSKYHKEKGLLEKYKKLHQLTKEYIEIGGDREDIISFYNPYVLVDELKDVFNEALISKIAGDASSVRFGKTTFPFMYSVKVIHSETGFKKNSSKNILKIISTKEYLSDVQNKINDLIQNRFHKFELKAVSKKAHYILWIGGIVISFLCFIFFILATET